MGIEKQEIQVKGEDFEETIEDAFGTNCKQRHLPVRGFGGLPYKKIFKKLELKFLAF